MSGVPFQGIGHRICIKIQASISIEIPLSLRYGECSQSTKGKGALRSNNAEPAKSSHRISCCLVLLHTLLGLLAPIMRKLIQKLNSTQEISRKHRMASLASVVFCLLAPLLLLVEDEDDLAATSMLTDSPFSKPAMESGSCPLAISTAFGGNPLRILGHNSIDKLYVEFWLEKPL